MPNLTNKTYENGAYSDLVTIGNWKNGILNKLPDSSIPLDGLSDAINIELDNDGKAKLRKGTLKVLDGSFSNAFSTKDGKTNLILQNGSLKRLSVLNGNVTSTSVGVSLNKNASFLELNNEIYYSDGSSKGIITSSGKKIWGYKSPKTKPSVSATNTGGSLKAGAYHVCYTYLYGKVESSPSPVETVFIEEPYQQKDYGGKINISVSSSSGATGVRVYCSNINGSTFYRISGTTVGDYNDLKGAELTFSTLDEIPAMTNLTYYNSRIWGNVNENLYFSDVFNYNFYDPTRGVIGIDGTKINLILSINGGLIVSTQKGIYSLIGQSILNEDNGFGNFQLTKIHEFSYVDGTLFKDEDEEIFGFLTINGVLLFDKNGTYQNISQDKVAFPSNYKSGASMFRKQDGIKSVTFSLAQLNGENVYINKDHI